MKDRVESVYSRILRSIGRLILTCVMIVALTPRNAVAADGLPNLSTVHPELDGDRLLVRIESDAPFAYRVFRSRTPRKVVVDIAAAADRNSIRSWSIAHPAIDRVRVDSGPLGARLVVDLAYDLPAPTVVYDGARLDVALPTRFRLIEEVSVASGIRYGTIRSGEVFGPVKAKYLRVDLTRAAVSPALASEVFDLGTVREIAGRAGAIGAVNGGFFDRTGRPIGLLVLDGSIVSEPVFGRTAFLIDRSGAPYIFRAESALGLAVSSGDRIAVDGINRPRERGEIVVYTRHVGILPDTGGGRIHVRGSTVVGVETEGSHLRRLSDGEWAIDFDASDPRLQSLAVGTEVRFDYALSGDGRFFTPDEIAFALGGGPRLVQDGRVDVTGVEERFQPDVLQGRAPRTAIGVTADRHLILLVVDGRDEGASVGATLAELARLMVELGAVCAMNLDGGGSSTLVLGGITLNRPSDGAERPVANALLVFSEGGERTNRSEVRPSRGDLR